MNKIEAVCPVCCGEMETTPFGYGCSNYKKDGSGCNFSIGTIAGRDLAEEEVVELLTKGHTEVLSGFISKSRKRFSAALVLEKDENGKASVNFDFSKNEPEILEGVKCPVCGVGMYGNKSIKHKADGSKYKDFYYYGCKHRTMTRGHKCDFKKQIHEELLDSAVAEVIVKLVSNPKFAAMMQEKSA